MLQFYKIKLLLICICTVLGSFEETVALPKSAVEQQVVPLSYISTIADGKLERNKRGLLDYILSGLYDYFDYSDEDDSEENEKYLVCRNCTIVIRQSGDQENAAIKPPATAATVDITTNGRSALAPSHTEAPTSLPKIP